MLAALEVPIAGVYELDSARHVWLATRRVAVATLPPGSAAPPGATALRARLFTGTERELGNAQLIKKLLDGTRAAFQVYAGDDLEGTAQRLAPSSGPIRPRWRRCSARRAEPCSHPASGSRLPTSSSRAGTRRQLEIELVTPQPGPS